jgi:hypothetical protein
MNNHKKELGKFMNHIHLTACISWILSCTILFFKLDIITYLAFVLYGLGVSGITIYVVLKAIGIKEENKNGTRKRIKKR